MCVVSGQVAWLNIACPRVHRDELAADLGEALRAVHPGVRGDDEERRQHAGHDDGHPGE